MTLPSPLTFLPRIRRIPKNNMKKLLSTVVASVLLCASLLTGCATVPVESVPSQTVSDDDFLVGMVVYESKRSESGYTYTHIRAVMEAMEAVGLDPDKDLKIRDNIIDADQALRANIEDLVVMGCDIIIGTSYEYADTFAELAEQYPEVVFCNAAGVISNSTNYINYSGRIYQAFYLAGIAAGYKSLDVETEDIGFVSSWGTKHAQTCADVNAFALGALAVNPEATIHVYSVDSWSDPDAEYRAAQTLVSRYHCGIIAQDCDSAEPQILAEEDGIFGCGYSYDMSEDAPEAHLTAPVINWEVYYELALRTAMNESAASEFVSNMGGNYFGSFTEGFIDITPLTDNNVPEAAEAIELARVLMISGEWDVFSGIALEFSGEEGSVTVEQVRRALMDNEDLIMVDGGDPSVGDVEIRGYMNVYVEGVIDES